MDYFRSDGEWAKLKGKYKKWYDALMSKKENRTNDKWEGGVPGTPRSWPKRAGYIGVFEVTDIRITDDHSEHSFKLCALAAKC